MVERNHSAAAAAAAAAAASTTTTTVNWRRCFLPSRRQCCELKSTIDASPIMGLPLMGQCGLTKYS